MILMEDGLGWLLTPLQEGGLSLKQTFLNAIAKDPFLILETLFLLRFHYFDPIIDVENKLFSVSSHGMVELVTLAFHVT